MNRSTRILLTAAAFAALSTPTAAQEMGTIDAALLFRYSQLDDNAAAEAGIGFSGRLGAFLWRNVALEATHAGSKTSDSPEARQSSLHLHLTRHFPFNEGWTGIIGAGWVRDRTNAVAPTGLLESDGASLVAGLQRNFTERVGLRVDAIYDYIPVARYTGPSETASHLHF